MAYLYGSETADPPVSESIEDGGYAPKAAPWESAPWSRLVSATGSLSPLTRQDEE